MSSIPDKNICIYIAGHRGLVGSAIVRKLQSSGYQNLVMRTHDELDLTNQSATNDFLHQTRPDYVFLAAAKVGGIQANNVYRAEFIYENLMIQTNIINSSYQAGVKNLLFLGSSCIYPRDCPQPIKEEYLLTGKLEHTNEPYAIAKIAGIKQCESYNSQYGTSYISVMPTNLYGPNDNFDLESSHVIPALIRKFHAAVINNQDRVEVWGTGSPKREFLHVDDMASACVYLMENKWSSKEINPLYNVGTGKDLTIMELAYLIKDISGFQGDIVFDTTKPDGTPRKVLDTSLITKTGWKPQLSLEEGLKDTYHWYVENKAD